jgi:carbon monoxide dehydrogenase subunit G
MRLEGEYVFDGPREEVWKIVRDPDVLATALPGTQSLEQVGENEYTGQMHLRIGPVSGVFAGRLVVSDEVPPESYTLSVDGRGAPGFGKGVGSVLLVDHGDDKTLLKYEGDIQVGGRIASVGQRLIDTASRSMIGQGLDALNEALKARQRAKQGYGPGHASAAAGDGRCPSCGGPGLCRRLPARPARRGIGGAGCAGLAPRQAVVLTPPRTATWGDERPQLKGTRQERGDEYREEQPQRHRVDNLPRIAYNGACASSQGLGRRERRLRRTMGGCISQPLREKRRGGGSR